MLPNFLLVGAGKAGTTTLASMLNLHPEIFMCKPKEPNFFNGRNWNKGLEWYESLFAEAKGYKAVGEASPSYTNFPKFKDVPQRIYSCLGDIKYLYIVRNPIDRMISHYRHILVYRRISNDTTFEQALKLFPSIKYQSRYFYQIEQFLKFTNRKQWKVIIFEELFKDHQKVMKEIFSFLDVNENIYIDLLSKNVSDRKIVFPMIFKYLFRYRRYFPNWLVNSGKKLFILFKIGHKPVKPVINEELKLSLIEDFRSDIKNLSEFIGKDLIKIWNWS